MDSGRYNAATTTTATCKKIFFSPSPFLLLLHMYSRRFPSQRLDGDETLFPFLSPHLNLSPNLNEPTTSCTVKPWFFFNESRFWDKFELNNVDVTTKLFLFYHKCIWNLVCFFCANRQQHGKIREFTAHSSTSTLNRRVLKATLTASEIPILHLDEAEERRVGSKKKTVPNCHCMRRQ